MVTMGHHTPDNTWSQVKENGNIIGYFGKNIYKTNDFRIFKNIASYILILRSETLKI